MTRASPIGVFDSGCGGLSVLRAIRGALPREDLLYCADHACLPYGERSPEAIRDRARAVAGAMVAAGCKALVIACNTATAAAAGTLRAELAVPVVGMEPAIKPAAAATRTGVIGVLGTGGTLASARFAALLERHAGASRVLTRPCPELVLAVERGEAGSEATRALVAAAVRPLLAEGADVLVLGCTHFPWLRGDIEAIAGGAVTVIDTGPAVARQLERRLDEAGALRSGSGPAGTTAFWTTGEPAAHQAVLANLWGSGRFAACPLGEPAARAADQG
jgi:glutamate racemase